MREGLPDFTDQGRAPTHAKLREADLSQEELIIAAELLLNQRAYVSRIIHEVRAEDGHLFNRVAREIALPTLEKDGASVGQDASIFVALVFPERGVLVDNLSTDSSQAGRVPIVESGISRFLTGRILHFLTLELFETCSDTTRSEALRVLSDLELILETDVSFQHSPGDATSGERALATLSTLPGASGIPRWEEKRIRVIDLWRASLSSYIVFGRVPARLGEQVSVTVEFTTPMSVDNVGLTPVPDQRVGRRLSRERLRYVIGLRPHVYRFPLMYELATRSYHLRFDQPSDQYIYRVDIQRHGVSQRPGHSVVMRDPESTVTRYAHVYVRPLVDAQPSGELHVRIDARERPPGLLGLTALVATLQAIFILFVLLAYPWLFVEEDPNPDLVNYVPALMLSIPGLLSAWLANHLTPERTQRTSLAAAGGIVLNGVIAIVGTLMAVAAVHGKDWLRFSENGEIDPWLVGNPLWLGIGLVSAWHACNLGGRFIQNTIIFLSRLRQKPQLSYREC